MTTQMMTPAQLAQQGNRNLDGSGEYTEKSFADPGDVLDAGPRAAIEAWAAENQVNLRDLQEALEFSNLTLQLPADQLVESDLVDLEPIIRAYGDPVKDEPELDVAEGQMAYVLSVEDDGHGALVIHTDQGSWAVPPTRPVDLWLGECRCSTCGVPTDTALHCAECAEPVERAA